MIKYRIFTYQRIVVLNAKRLKELESLLSKHCDNIDYIAITKNDAEILFDSFDELIGFNNFGEDKIISLKIECHKTNSNNFMLGIVFSPKFPFQTDTVRCKYCFSNIDEESVFITDFNKFLDKVTIYHIKYMLCEWASFFFFIFLGLYPIFIPVNGTPVYQTTRGIYPMIIKVFVFEVVPMTMYCLCSKLIWKRLYPRAIYAWGEEEEKYSKLEGLRSNLFWGVFLATCINIIVGLILK